MRDDWSATDYGWAAGFLDGEGHIGLAPRASRKGYTLAVSAQQVDPKPLRKLSRRFGGNVLGPYYNKGFIYSWTVTNLKALEVLSVLHNLFVVKQEEANLGIRFYQDTTKGPELAEAILKVRSDRRANVGNDVQRTIV